MDRTPWYEKYKVMLPEGTSGDWAVKHFSVSQEDAHFESLRAMISGSGRGARPGNYTGIFHKGAVIMSDTPDEIRDHLNPINEAGRRGGHVLINGLGIGMVASAILHNAPNVERVTVIELSTDVIALVAPTLRSQFGSRLDIIPGDAFTYKSPKGIRYSVVWHDIWANLCTDNLKEMGTLHRRYGRCCDWQGSWGKEYLLYQRRRERLSHF